LSVEVPLTTRVNHKHNFTETLPIYSKNQSGLLASILESVDKQSTMSNLLYLIAAVLIIFWLLGFFIYSAGAIIHLLLVIAIIAILFRVIRGERL
jgi:hypothetical protein